MDRKAIEEHIKGILKAIGEDPEREGLRETPQRVARMLEEVLEGTAYSNHEIAEMFGKTFEYESCADSESAVVMKLYVYAIWRLKDYSFRKSSEEILRK